MKTMDLQGNSYGFIAGFAGFLTGILVILFFLGNAFAYEIEVHNSGDCVVEASIHYMRGKHNQSHTLGVDETIVFDTGLRCPRMIKAKIYGRNHTYFLEKCLNPTPSCDLACGNSGGEIIKKAEEEYDLVQIR